jgi:hypothetical protein
MIRRHTLALALVLATTALAVDATGQERRRPVTNPQLTVDGLISAASHDTLRVQTPSGTVTVSIGTGTEIVRAGNLESLTASNVGQYTLTDAVAGNDGTIAARRVILFDVPASAAAEETVRVEGKVASVAPEASTLTLDTRRGVLTVSVNDTTVIRRDGDAIGLSGIAVGDFAFVAGKPTGDRTLLALKIDLRSQPPSRPHDAVAGEVVEVRAAEQSLLVRRALPGPRPAAGDLVVVRATAETESYRHRERIRFVDITKGDFVLAIGELDGAGALVALRIDVATLPEPAPRIAGRVLEVSTTEKKFTVAVERAWLHDSEAGPVTVIVGDATKIYRERELVRFTEIKAGEFVHVAGEWNAEKALVASVIHIAPPLPTPPLPLVLGEITAIEPATRTLVVRVRAMRPLENATDGTVKVLVGDDTKIFRNGEPSRFAELKVGEIVSVIGEVRDDGAILARRIDALVVPPRPSQVMGYVASVSAAAIDIIVPQAYPTFAPVHVVVHVDAATEIFRNGERVRLSAIKPNDILFASGAWRDDANFLARKIEARAMPELPAPVDLHGTIEAVEQGGTLLVATRDGRWAVTATRMTVIVRGQRPIRFDELKVGETVDVTGMAKGEHALVALKIEVVP